MTLLQRSTATIVSLFVVVTYPMSKAMAQTESLPEVQQAETLLQADDMLADDDDEYTNDRPRQLAFGFSRPRLSRATVGFFANSELPYRTCDQSVADDRPFRVPTLPVRRRGRGLRSVPRISPLPRIPSSISPIPSPTVPRFVPSPELQPVE